MGTFFITLVWKLIYKWAEQKGALKHKKKTYPERKKYAKYFAMLRTYHCHRMLRVSRPYKNNTSKFDQIIHDYLTKCTDF